MSESLGIGIARYPKPLMSRTRCKRGSVDAEPKRSLTLHGGMHTQFKVHCSPRGYVEAHAFRGAEDDFHPSSSYCQCHNLWTEFELHTPKLGHKVQS